MKHKTVNSTVVKKLEWKNEELTVVLHSGNRYTYSGVSQQKFRAMGNAKSVGQFFATKIRGKYRVKNG